MPIKFMRLELQQAPKILCHNLTFQSIAESYDNFFEFHGRASNGNRPPLRHVLPTNNTMRGCNMGRGMTARLFAVPLPIAALYSITSLTRRRWCDTLGVCTIKTAFVCYASCVNFLNKSLI